MTNRIILFLFTLLFSSAAVLPQSLEEIVTKNHEARGGLKNIKAVQTIELTGKMSMMGKDYPFSVYHKRGGGFRSEMKMGKSSIIQAFDGKVGWQIIPMAGTLDPIEITGSELRNIREEADFDGYLVDWKEKGYKLESLGIDKSDSTVLLHIKIIGKDTTERHVYLDSKTFLEVKNTQKTILRGEEIEIVNTLGDYRKVENLVMPFSMQSVGGMPQKVQFEKIVINQPIADSIFTRPKHK